MATFTNDLRLKEIGTGDESGTWGTSTNTNLSLIADAFSLGTKQMAADADETFTMPDASADGTRSLYLKITSAVSLTVTRTVTLAPNTVSKVWIIENATSGSQSITISQGSGASVTIATGTKAMIVTDGAGGTAAVFLAGPTVSTLTGILPVANGGTNLASGTSGGILAYTASGTLASSAALTQYGVVYGGGAGAVPVATAAGTTGQVLTATTGGAPAFATPAASGTVTSVAATVPSLLSITGSPITSSGTLAFTYSGTALPVANGGTGLATLGTAGQVLAVNSGVTALEYVALPAGAAATETSSAVDIALTSTSAQIQAIAMTVAASKVTLPDATTLSAGTSFIIKNTGTLDFVVRKNGGLFLATLRPDQIAIFYCTNIGAAAGTWAVGDESVGDVLNSIFAQTAVTIASVTGEAQTAVCALSATQAVAVFRGTSNYLNACTLNLDSSNVLTAGTILVVNAVASSSMAVTAMSSTQAIVVYAGTSTFLEARTLNVSGTTVTSGTVLIVNATGTTQQSITTMSSTQAIVVYAGVSNYPEACTLNVSGTDLTNGAVVQIVSNTSNSMAVAMATSTVAFCAYRNSSTFPAYARLTVSGTDITVHNHGAVGDADCTLVRIANINSTTSAVFWRSALTGDNGNLMARVISNPSGNSYNKGGAIILPFAPTDQMYATKMRDNKIMIFTNGNGAQYGQIILLTVQGGLVIETDSATIINSMSTTRNSVASFSDTLAVAVYMGTSDYKYANVIEITP